MSMSDPAPSAAMRATTEAIEGVGASRLKCRLASALAAIEATGAGLGGTRIGAGGRSTFKSLSLAEAGAAEAQSNRGAVDGVEAEPVASKLGVDLRTSMPSGMAAREGRSGSSARVFADHICEPRLTLRREPLEANLCESPMTTSTRQRCARLRLGEGSGSTHLESNEMLVVLVALDRLPLSLRAHESPFPSAGSAEHGRQEASGTENAPRCR